MMSSRYPSVVVKAEPFGRSAAGLDSDCLQQLSSRRLASSLFPFSELTTTTRRTMSPQTDPADPYPETTFVSGKPLTDIWSAASAQWRSKLAATIRTPLRNPFLRFVRNDRTHFDLDNLVYPILQVSGCQHCESVWATHERGDNEGVWISEQRPPAPPNSAVSVLIAKPNTSSVAIRPSPPELIEQGVVAAGAFLGLALEFESDSVPIGELSYQGPTKSLIDDLAPLLGSRQYGGRFVSDDERVKELRITRGLRPGGLGVRVSAWPLKGYVSGR
jgi:hypothetical protein